MTYLKNKLNKISNSPKITWKVIKKITEKNISNKDDIINVTIND